MKNKYPEISKMVEHNGKTWNSETLINKRDIESFDIDGNWKNGSL